ncbi:MAG: regulator of cell morphoproteinis and NO signaling [bacterium P3]|nr:MAG: regulator of cell morphoproteinis and NO signaling [bacterium P3]KWW40958.1 MAG: regulator of cell morphoproteinis and NO signaling [bacterium F083]
MKLNDEKYSAMSKRLFTSNMKLADLVASNHNLILMLPRFGLPLGFGNHRVKEICHEHGIDEDFFMLICNIYTFDDYLPDADELSNINLRQLVPYLQTSHRYYIEERLPHLQRHLSHLTGTMEASVAAMLTRFFEDYRRELALHFEQEEQRLFPYIERMQNGERIADKVTNYFIDSHHSIKDKLRDLMQILYKYLPGDSMNEELIELVFDILQLSEDLEKHTVIEERLLMPSDDYELSDREKDVLVLVAKGLSSKEIADKLCLSVHTVNSHRKNITRKTGIKSVAGLAAYAMICKLG